MGQKSKKTQVTASIYHLIYLSEEQRYKLAAGNSLNVIGVSIPVWFYKERTSEPATEVFSRYKLTNNLKNDAISVAEQGYIINVPQLPDDFKQPEEMSNDDWRLLSEDEQELWYAQNKKPPTASDLLNLEDGGAERLYFRQYNKIHNPNKVILNILHVVEIKDLTVLVNTIED